VPGDVFESQRSGLPQPSEVGADAVAVFSLVKENCGHARIGVPLARCPHFYVYVFVSAKAAAPIRHCLAAHLFST
jgi:hypothetical protein